MDESDKIAFEKKYGIDNYLIINKYNLWNVDPNILYDLNYAIIDYCTKLSNNLKVYYDYVGILRLENWDKEKLYDLERAIFYLIIFRPGTFMNCAFKEELKL